MLDEQQLNEAEQNSNIRGYILRCLNKGKNRRLLVKQITNSLMADGLIISPDISNFLEDLVDREYIEFTDQRVTAFNAYRHDAVIKLTKKGVNLLEGHDTDAGVDV